MTDDVRRATERQPLPSEDTGDLVRTPDTGMTDDPMVASEEGVPYEPPTDRVLTQRPPEEGEGELPADDELLALVGGVPGVEQVTDEIRLASG